MVVQDTELQASQDPSIYSESECSRLLDSIDAGNQAHGGLALVLEVKFNLQWGVEFWQSGCYSLKTLYEL